jgi:hypothetical protein
MSACCRAIEISFAVIPKFVSDEWMVAAFDPWPS